MNALPRRLQANQDRGAIAVLTAVLFSSMVLLGCAALAVDVGRISAERRLLQNGADAIALSVAKDCAKAASCLPGGGLNQTLADDNAGADEHTQIGRLDGWTASYGTAICGVGPALDACPALEAHLRDCVEPTSAMPDTWVRVYTTTQTTADPGDTLLPHIFAQTLSGAAGDGHQVQACAQAGLVGAYDSKHVVPLIQSMCAWEAATANGTKFPPPPPYSPPPDMTFKKPPTVPAVVEFDRLAKIVVKGDPTSGGPAACGKTGPGHYEPGNFGWLDQVGDEKTTCEAETMDGTVGGTGGVSASKGCQDVLPSLVGSTVYIPIAQSSTGTGSGTEYTVEGLAAFYLAGVDFNGASGKKTYNGYDPSVKDPADGAMVMVGCDPADTTSNGCLWGWFLDPLLPPGSAIKSPGGGVFGPTTIGLLG